MLRHYTKLLELFPFSKLSERELVMRVYAIEFAEPPLIERPFLNGTDPADIVTAAAEFAQEDCAVQIDGMWDLWQFDEEWKLAPTPVTLLCFGPSFDRDADDDLRIEFGSDARFLPQPRIEDSLRPVQSNIRSLLHLVSEIDKTFKLERRQLSSESGANFAEVLMQALEPFNA
jgi:hypothetical protein